VETDETLLDRGPFPGNDQPAPAPAEESRPARDAGGPGRKKRPAPTPLPQWRIVANLFYACARCGYFLEGYRLLHKDFEAAVGAATGGWLDLSWSAAVRHLVEKSFGCHSDVDSIYYSALCPDCHRSFVYEAAGETAERDTLRIQVRPR
jgi:hypothetical protein